MKILTLYRKGGKLNFYDVDGDGEIVEIEYDDEAPCRICGKPVFEASMGGTDICPWCDCGRNRDGTPWTEAEFRQFMRLSPP